jgi:hypothetical protein
VPRNGLLTGATAPTAPNRSPSCPHHLWNSGLNLDIDLIFFDTTSTYVETPFEDGELDGTDEGLRKRGHSKDARPDLPQIVIGMAVTTGGLPVRLWVWPGDTGDQTVLAEVKQDLAGWRLNRTVWVVDAGFTSGANRKILTGGGSGFIIAEKLRGNETAPSRPAQAKADSAPWTRACRSNTSASARGSMNSGHHGQQPRCRRP